MNDTAITADARVEAFIERWRLSSGAERANYGLFLVELCAPPSRARYKRWHVVEALQQNGRAKMKVKVVVHEAEEGGFWAEVPAIPGCASQGETIEELLQNLREAIEGCLSIEVAAPEPGGTEQVLELA